MKRTFLGILVIALWFSLTGCAGSISGEVYFDHNNNGVQDLGETGAPFAHITVFKDGQEIDRGYSDQLGHFETKSKGIGEYCFRVDTSLIEANIGEIQNISANFLNDAGPAPAVGSKFASVGGEDNECTDADGNGVCDYDDESGDDQDDDGEDREDADEDDDDDEELSPTPTPPVGASYCQETKRNLHATIGIGVDYDEVVGGFPTRLRKTVHPGEEFEIKIFYPKGCTLDDMFLPEIITVASDYQGGTFNPSLGRVTFRSTEGPAAMATKAKAAASNAPVASISIDEIEINTLKLVVADELPERQIDYSIQPIARCADVKTTLPPIPLTIEQDLDIDVILDKRTVSPVSGGILSFSATVKNTGESVVTDGILKIGVPDRAQFTEDDGCANLGKKVRCDLPRLEPGAEREYFFKVSLPEVTVDTTMTFPATFEHDALENPLEAEAIEFELIAPEPVTP